MAKKNKDGAKDVEKMTKKEMYAVWGTTRKAHMDSMLAMIAERNREVEEELNDEQEGARKVTMRKVEKPIPLDPAAAKLIEKTVAKGRQVIRQAVVADVGRKRAAKKEEKTMKKVVKTVVATTAKKGVKDITKLAGTDLKKYVDKMTRDAMKPVKPVTPGEIVVDIVVEGKKKKVAAEKEKIKIAKKGGPEE